jgi:hypothetical protein
MVFLDDLTAIQLAELDSLPEQTSDRSPLSTVCGVIQSGLKKDLQPDP